MHRLTKEETLLNCRPPGQKSSPLVGVQSGCGVAETLKDGLKEVVEGTTSAVDDAFFVLGGHTVRVDAAGGRWSFFLSAVLGENNVATVPRL